MGALQPHHTHHDIHHYSPLQRQAKHTREGRGARPEHRRPRGNWGTWRGAGRPAFKTQHHHGTAVDPGISPGSVTRPALVRSGSAPPSPGHSSKPDLWPHLVLPLATATGLHAAWPHRYWPPDLWPPRRLASLLLASTLPGHTSVLPGHVPVLPRHAPVTPPVLPPLPLCRPIKP